MSDYYENFTNEQLHHALAKAVAERDEWKAKFIQANKDYGFELRDPCGTIWDHAKKLQQKHDEARKQLRVAVGLLSTTPQFQDQHPEEVLKFVEEAAK